MNNNDSEITSEKMAVMIRDIIKNTPKNYDANYEEVGKIDEEIQDLLHLLEMSDVSATLFLKTAMEIKDLRIKRRVLKDENELLEPLVEVAKNNSSLLQKLDKCVGEIRKINKRLQNRTYTPRVRNELREKINGQVL
jgi:DNA-binding protein YbaB